MEAVSLDRHQKKAQRLRAHLAFLDESGFLLIPNVRRTWAPRGQTPIVWHRYRHDRVSAISAVTVSFRRQHVGLYFHLHRENITQSEVVLFRRFLRSRGGRSLSRTSRGCMNAQSKAAWA